MDKIQTIEELNIKSLLIEGITTSECLFHSHLCLNKKVPIIAAQHRTIPAK
jgi:hypothetical protein